MSMPHALRCLKKVSDRLELKSDSLIAAWCGCWEPSVLLTAVAPLWLLLLAFLTWILGSKLGPLDLQAFCYLPSYLPSPLNPCFFFSVFFFF